MEKIYEMVNRHKEELIEKYIKPFVPFKQQEGKRELVLYDNSVEDAMYRVFSICEESGDLLVSMTNLAEWSLGSEVTTMVLSRLEYEHLVTIAEYLSEK